MKLLRWGGVAAMVAGVLGLVLTPLATFAGWLAGPDQTMPPQYPDMLWARLIKPLVTPFLGFGTYEEVYATYGKVFFLVYVLFLLGLVALRAAVGPDLSRSGTQGFKLARIGLAMNLLGNVGDYWLGKRVLGQPLWGIAFAVGTLLGTLVYMSGSVILGRAILQTTLLPRWTGWTLSIAPTLGIVVGSLVIRHLPSALVLPVGLGWLLLGYGLWSGRGTVRGTARRS
ncbi:MAG: hypothetical protein NVS2B7_13110 [Herpetosiphon sp.]